MVKPVSPPLRISTTTALGASPPHEAPNSLENIEDSTNATSICRGSVAAKRHLRPVGGISSYDRVRLKGICESGRKHRLHLRGLGSKCHAAGSSGRPDSPCANKFAYGLLELERNATATLMQIAAERAYAYPDAYDNSDSNEAGKRIKSEVVKGEIKEGEFPSRFGTILTFQQQQQQQIHTVTEQFANTCVLAGPDPNQIHTEGRSPVDTDMAPTGTSIASLRRNLLASIDLSQIGPHV